MLCPGLMGRCAGGTHIGVSAENVWREIRTRCYRVLEAGAVGSRSGHVPDRVGAVSRSRTASATPPPRPMGVNTAWVSEYVTKSAIRGSVLMEVWTLGKNSVCDSMGTTLACPPCRAM
uniref:Uncharacterized protein n=1 Tax=Cacopsylla melanoneura TaxID=428564 RepID=A0A8D8T548_9HEMI